ncbi:hypothetical protein LguiB_005974 [Lonicera macranthoides]
MNQVLSISLADASVNVENPIYLQDGMVRVEKPLMKSIKQNLTSKSSEFSMTYDVTTTLSWIIRGTCNISEERRLNGSDGPLVGTSNSCSPNSWCRPSEDSLNNATQFSKGSSVTDLTCDCKEGYDGNPYLPDGCQAWDARIIWEDIDASVTPDMS